MWIIAVRAKHALMYLLISDLKRFKSETIN